MIPELFSIAVPAAISGVVSGATHRLLDTVVGCPSCNVRHERTVTNYAENAFSCSCSKFLDQYVAAAPSTLVKGKLMSAQIFNPRWETKKGTLGGIQGHWFMLDISTSGMANNGIVVEGQLDEFRGAWKQKLGHGVFNNPSDKFIHQRIHWWFDTVFPRGDIIASVSVKTTNGDTLHEISPPFKFQ